MTRPFLYILLASLFFISCKKDHRYSNPPGKTYKVNFNISGFTQTIIDSIKNTGNLRKIDNVSSDTSSSDSLTVLDYQIYNSKGLAVHKLLTETSTTGTFPVISDNLVAGTYTVVLVAGKSGLTYNTAANSPMSSDWFTDENSMGWEDTFYKQFTVTVSANDTTINTTLSRIVAQLEINIEDAIPSKVKTIRLNISNCVEGVGITGEFYKGNNIGVIDTIPPSAVGTTNFKLYNILAADTTAPMSIIITAHDSLDNLYGYASVNNVICKPNERTILTGDLFGTGTGGGNSFQLSLNNKWVSTPYLTISY